MTAMHIAPWRMIDSGVVSPEFSAAADEAILNARVRDIVPNTLHFYIRDRPTISLGCNQSTEQSLFMDEIRRRGVKVIRRCTGGSAIFTDERQLIFALIMGREQLPSDVLESYKVVCSAIIRGLRTLGIEPEHRPVNDIVLKDRKISGSAQLRRGGSVLHQGTILVDTDLECMASVLKSKGDSSEQNKHPSNLNEITGKKLEMKDLKRAIKSGIAESFNVILEESPLTTQERSEIELLICNKYGTEKWNLRG